MPPKAASRRQPRRNVKGQPTSDAQDAPALSAEYVVEESEQEASITESQPQRAESPSLTDPDQQLQTSESLQPSARLKRNNSALNAPPSDANVGSSSPKPVLKFKPRADVARRNKDELEAQRKLEEERRLERIAEAERDRASGSHLNRGVGSDYSRGRGNRGRGRVSSRGVLMTDRAREGLASGPLGDGRVIPGSSVGKQSTKPGEERGPSRSKDVIQTREHTTTTVKKEPGVAAATTRARKPRQKDPVGAKSGANASKSKQEEIEIVEISSDEDLGHGLRVNIEDINADIDESDSDDDPVRVRDRSFERKTPVKPGWATRPVRVDRSEHIPRSVGVNTDASSAMSAEMRQRSREKTGETVDLSGALEVINTSSKGKSKEVEIVGHERRWRGVYEDEEDEHPAIKEEPDDTMDIDSATINRIPAQENQAHHPMEDVGGPADDTAANRSTRRRKQISFREPKGVFQTDEDRKEWSRHERDVRLLSEELSNLYRDSATMDEDAEPPEPQDDCLYVFQFPALTPLLNVRPEHEKIVIADPEAIPIPIPSARQSKTPAIKLEVEEPVKIKSISADKAQLPGGHVGKLRVRQSGRVTLDWGGTSFELGRGSESDFLQDVVVVRRDVDEKEHGSTSWALSQISGKFIVTPDWENIFS